jgi:hypothetical protein
MGTDSNKTFDRLAVSDSLMWSAAMGGCLWRQVG